MQHLQLDACCEEATLKTAGAEFMTLPTASPACGPTIYTVMHELTCLLGHTQTCQTRPLPILCLAVTFGLLYRRTQFGIKFWFALACAFAIVLPLQTNVPAVAKWSPSLFYFAICICLVEKVSPFHADLKSQAIDEAAGAESSQFKPCFLPAYPSPAGCKRS